MGFGGPPVVGAFGAPAPMMGPTSVHSDGSIQSAGIAFDNGSALAVAPQVESSPTLDVDAIREAVLGAMETGGSQMLVHALEEGNWSAEGNQVSVRVEMSAAMIELSYTREQEKLGNQAATKTAGRTVKVRLVGGAVQAEAKVTATRPRTAGTGGSESMKTRAADEPVVKRMVEKFGAEIRIVMDRSER
jgi:hypothetical protein